jgi:hypothetical protein
MKSAKIQKKSQILWIFFNAVTVNFFYAIPQIKHCLKITYSFYCEEAVSKDKKKCHSCENRNFLQIVND